MATCGDDPAMIEALKMDMGIDPVVAPLLEDFVLLSVEDEAGCDRMVDEGFISFPIIAIYDPAEDMYINEDRLSSDLLFRLPSFLRGR
jgi:hypothetical protein